MTVGTWLRAGELYATHAELIARRTDRLLAILLVIEWLVGIGLAMVLSRGPVAPGGTLTHRVWAAVFLGALLTLPAAAVAFARPGRTTTRHAVAIGQMMWGGLLIHLTGGRIASHFHVFGSLALLAFYRDWRVLATATLAVIGDHLLRGANIAPSLYGVSTVSPWRALEHASWMIFEDVFLLGACVQARREMRAFAARHAELEEAQEELRQSTAEAELASRSKSEFLANMSHEIRTPMTAVQGFADLLLDPTLTEGERLEYSRIIRRNSGHLLRVIDDILDLAKIEAGRMTVERVACSPAAVVAEVAALLNVRALVRGLDLEVAFDTPIPATISTDPTRLRQVLLNLVSNAIKFTERGRVELRVSYQARDARSCLRFVVTDTGIGMTPEQLATVFSPFVQADSSTTRRYGGTGLGLAICERLAGMLGGEIAIDSELGRGTQCTLSIDAGPVAQAAAVDSIVEPVDMPATASSAARMCVDGRVLLVEDGPDNQTLMTALLRRAGATVELATTGRAAVARVLEERRAGVPFDLVLLDMQMPDLDGYSAARLLRRSGYTGPVVAATAHAMAGDRDQCLAAGCDDYLPKPIDDGQLLAVLRRHLPPRVVATPSSRVSVPFGLWPAVDVPVLAEASSTYPLFGEPLTSEALTASPSTGDSRTDDPLISEIDEPELGSLIADFVTALPARCQAIRDALERRDHDAAFTLAHQLKGSAGGYGFPTITESAGTLEDALVGRRPADAIRAQLDGLTALCARARAAPSYRES